MPKFFNLTNVNVSNASQIVYSYMYKDYSSCIDIFAQDFQRYLKNGTTFLNAMFALI